MKTIYKVLSKGEEKPVVTLDTTIKVLVKGVLVDLTGAISMGDNGAFEFIEQKDISKVYRVKNTGTAEDFDPDTLEPKYEEVK